MNYNSKSEIFLVDRSEKDKKWDEHRSDTQIVEAIYANAGEDFSRKAEKLRDCSTLLFFAMDNDNLNLKSASFCKSRTCSICSWRRSKMWQARIFSALPKIQEKNPNLSWILLTLTLKNCPLNELKNTIKLMQSAWSKLRRRKAFKPFLGYIKTLEVTRGKDGSAHPHFHILLCVKNHYFTSRYYLSQAKMTEIWQESLQVDYVPVVDMRKVRTRGGKDIHTAVLEVVKYETKLSDMKDYPEFLLEYTNQMNRVRSLELGGLLKKFMKEGEAKNDDELISESEDEDENDITKLVAFGWKRKIKRYTYCEKASIFKL